LENLNYLDRFSKNTQILVSNFMKIRPVEAELFHADRRTDTTKLIIAYSNFANALKMVVSECIADAAKKGLRRLVQNS
jgi:hypothetical protein